MRMAIYWSINLRSGFALGTASMHLLAASIRDFSAELRGMMNAGFYEVQKAKKEMRLFEVEKEDVFDYFHFNLYRTLISSMFVTKSTILKVEILTHPA
jgi:hypothetical protein